MMPRRHLALAASATAAVLALPAQAMAGTHRAAQSPAGAAARVSATALAVDRRHHLLRVVTARHAVRTFHVRGSVPPAVKPGARVAVTVRRGRAVAVRVRSKTRTVRFYGRVVGHSGHGLVLRLGDRRTFRVGAPGAHHRRHARAARVALAPMSLDVQGLAPGQVVLVTLTVGDSGALAVTVRLVDSAQAGGDVVALGDGGDAIDDNGGADFTAAGTVTAIDSGAGTITVGTAQGELTFAAPDFLGDLTVGEKISVDFYRGAASGAMVADDVSDPALDGADPASDGTAEPGVGDLGAGGVDDPAAPSADDAATTDDASAGA